MILFLIKSIPLKTNDMLRTPQFDPIASQQRARAICRSITPALRPSELVLDESTMLFGRIIEKYSFSRGAIDSFNYWAEVLLPQKIESRTFRTASGRVSFKNVRVVPPETTPAVCRRIGTTYEFRVTATVELFNNGELTSTPPNTKIGKIPLMLGSNICPLSKMTPDELLKNDECPNDPLGYFIIEGSEKVVVTLERLRASVNITPPPDKNNIYRTGMTCQTIWGTSIMQVFNRKGSGTLDVRIDHIHSEDYTLPLFAVFAMLGYNENGALRLMKDFIFHPDATEREKRQRQLEFILQPSIAIGMHALAKAPPQEDGSATPSAPILSTGPVDIDSDDLNIYERIRKNSRRYNSFLSSSRYGTVPQQTPRGNIIRSLIIENTFPNIPFTIEGMQNNEKVIPYSMALKAQMLAIMTVQQISVMRGWREPDKRDDWQNKRIETVGDIMRQRIEFGLNEVEVALNASSKAGKPSRPQLVSQIATTIEEQITNIMTRAFRVNAWNDKNYSSGKSGIADQIDRGTPIAIYSQGRMVATPTDRKTKQLSIRMLQHSQVNFICIAETPEGSTCGLIKNQAITCTMSMSKNPGVIQTYVPELSTASALSYSVNTPTVTWVLSPDHSGEYLSSTSSIRYPYIFRINGIPCGYTHNGIIDAISVGIRENEYMRDMTIYRNGKYIEFNCDGSRPLRPVLVVNPDQTLVIEGHWNKPIDELFKMNAIRFISTNEQADAMIAADKTLSTYKRLQSSGSPVEEECTVPRDIPLHLRIKDANPDEVAAAILRRLAKKRSDSDPVDLTKNELFKAFFDPLTSPSPDVIDRAIQFLKPEGALEKTIFSVPTDDQYEFAEINPICMFGVAGCLAPKADSDQGPRTAYQCSMCKQALSAYNLASPNRFDSSYKVLQHPTRAIFETIVSEPAGLNLMPAGFTPIVAFMAMTNNNEDAIIVNSDFIDTDATNINKYTTFKRQPKLQEMFQIPRLKAGIASGHPAAQKHAEKYHAIGADGLPIIGKRLSQGDCVIAMIRIKDGVEENISVYIGVGEGDSYIDRVHISESGTLRVKIRQSRKHIAGDKIASRYAQKGVMAESVPACRLPRIMSGPNAGLVPDMIINPHSIPSRMTMGKIKEILTTKAALYTGERVNGTSFVDLVLEPYINTLIEAGLQDNGNEVMMHPDGKRIEAPIFTGPCFYQALRHHVLDKSQVRGVRGLIKMDSHQPIRGRSNEGGLRFGEMERDALISHGAAKTLVERLFYVSDPYDTPFCMNCGTMAISKVDAKPTCPLGCTGENNFSIVYFPYILKYIIHLAMGMGIGTYLGSTQDSMGAEDSRRLCL